jgi:1-acyl-sn-glycerol-3-phosphate acyltransferase
VPLRLGWRWVLVAARSLAILGWFLLVLAPHLAFTLMGRRDTLPPVFLRGVGWLAGLRVRTSGRAGPGRLLILANHVSWLDILALAGRARAAFVAHAGLAGHPFLRWLCEQNDTVFITRDRRATVSAQVDQVTAALARRRLVIFPEGTTGDGRSLLSFKSSLLSAAQDVQSDGSALTVQPVALDYADAAEIAWFGAETGGRNVLRLLARTAPVRLTIRFLEPLHGPQIADRKAMAAAAQATVASALRL